MKLMIEADRSNFFPCRYCSNVLTSECEQDWIDINKPVTFENFRLRPGTSAKDMPPFPLQVFMHEMSPNQRMLTVAIYLAVVTDYLQHMEEYENRDKPIHSEGGAPPYGSNEHSMDRGLESKEMPLVKAVPRMNIET